MPQELYEALTLLCLVMGLIIPFICISLGPFLSFSVTAANSLTRRTAGSLALCASPPQRSGEMAGSQKGLFVSAQAVVGAGKAMWTLVKQ